MMTLYNTFIQEAKQKKLFSENDKILVAFSGGKDSVCLLHLISLAAKEMNLTLAACHVHHGIRGAEADQDAEFAEDFCKKSKIPFYLVKADVPAFCKENGVGLEEGARLERYRLLKEVQNRIGFDKIATAHNSSDQAETVLFRLIRGTGFSGIAGIPEKRDGIIRPLLPFSKDQILSYCQSEGLTFTNDSSNDDIKIARNRMRNVILPQMKEINPKAENAIIRFSKMALWHEAMLEEAAFSWAEEHKLRPEDGKLPIEALWELCQKESSYPLLYKILSIMTKRTNISIPFERFLGIVSLLKAPLEGKIIEICSDHFFTVKNSHLLFDDRNENETVKDFFQKIKFGTNFIEDTDLLLYLGNEEDGSVTNINKKRLILEISSDNIEGDLSVRNYRSGDRIRINGMQKSIKKLFCDGGIPIEYRKRIPLLCDEKEILWVPFFGLCDKARNKNGKRKFVAELKGEELKKMQAIIERNSKNA